MRIAIGGDHAGYDLKEMIKHHLVSKSIEILDRGPFSDDSVDYPDFVHPVCQDVLAGTVELAILICGSGNGVAMTANKYQGIRCGLCWNSDIAALIRQHNNANILALPARFINESEAKNIIDKFLESSFEGGRHERRVNKITPDVHFLC